MGGTKRAVRNSDVIPYMREALDPRVRSVLDIGCGRLWDGNGPEEDYLFQLFSDEKYDVTGIDAHAPCVQWRREHGPPGTYTEVLAQNALIWAYGRQWDLVIAHHVVEHLELVEAAKLITDLEDMARYQVMVGCPTGFTDTKYAVGNHNNEHELHKSAWHHVNFHRYELVKDFGTCFLVQLRRP